MIDWLLSLIPWWAYLIAAVTAVVIVWRVFGWQGALAALAGIIAVLGYGKGRQEGAAHERSRRDREALDHVRIRNQSDAEIDALGAQDVDERLRRWNRD